MRIGFFELAEWEISAYQCLAGEHDLVCERECLDDSMARRHPRLEAISTRTRSDIGSSVLSAMPQLRFIATRSTGYDHIDLAVCRAKNITVCNVPDYGDHTVAEHAFALLLGLTRHLIEAVDRTQRGNFSQAGLRGTDLHDKTLGVIGTGRIGRCVIQIARGFGMRVLAYDRRPDEGASEQLSFRYTTFDNVLRESDILTLHVPATEETRGMISDRELGLMRRGSILINTARGEVVDIPALVRALAEERLFGAGLDVLPEESLTGEEAQLFTDQQADRTDLRALVANHVLLRFPNVIVTPHNAYNTHEAVGRIIETTLANIRAFARGSARNVVDTAQSGLSV